MLIVGIYPTGYYPVAQYFNTARKELAWGANPRTNLQMCADACREKKGCRGFEYAYKGSDQVKGACAIYTGADDDKADSDWYSCVDKSTLSG